MIRINLLPVKELMAAVRRRRELTIGSIVLGVAAFVLFVSFLYQTFELSTLNSELTTLRNDIQTLNVKVKEVGDLQNRIKEFSSKHKVIADLNKKKAGPVGVMESLSAATPSRLWLTEFKEIGGKLTISGFAADNQTVADFLKALAATAYFRDVELVETTQGSQEGGPFKRFTIRTAVYYLPQPAAKTAGGAAAATTQDKKS
ncbi:MAG TPA: PilN domain-containing protein [Terriglobales bacterium]|jgi:type IV pilus assembly protein PilN|nr:PilN domain-containing protein [Terriglobales bacterium]